MTPPRVPPPLPPARPSRPRWPRRLRPSHLAACAAGHALGGLLERGAATGWLVVCAAAKWGAAVVAGLLW